VNDDDTAEGRLLRDILGAAAHDIGGLSSALALRAETIPGEEGKAIGAIANELRELGRQLRHLRGPESMGRLAPGGEATLQRWSKVVEHFGRAILGRGFTFSVVAPSVNISAEHSDALTYGALALCRALHESASATPRSVTFVATEQSGTVRIAMRVSGTDSVQQALPPVESRWRQLAEHAWARSGLVATEHADELEICVPTSV
jgi:hypothetical protein